MHRFFRELFVDQIKIIAFKLLEPKYAYIDMTPSSKKEQIDLYTFAKFFPYWNS